MKKEAWRKVFWLIWSAGWIVLNIIWSSEGLVLPKNINFIVETIKFMFALTVEAIISCFVAYVMANSKFWMTIVVIAMVVILIGNFGVVRIICFIYNFILVIVTKILTPKETKR